MKPSTFLATVALVTVAIIPAAPSFAYDSSSGALNVRLVSTDGIPVQGMPITISANGLVVDAVTDANGTAHFASVHAGVVSVEAQERVLGGCAQTVSIKASRTTDVTFRMPLRSATTPFDTVGTSTGSCSTT